MRILVLAVTVLTIGWIHATEAVRSGHAAAKWLVKEASVTPGSALMTVVQLEVDPEWHVYWVNPGDAGMPTSVNLEIWLSKNRPLPSSCMKA